MTRIWRCYTENAERCKRNTHSQLEVQPAFKYTARMPQQATHGQTCEEEVPVLNNNPHGQKPLPVGCTVDKNNMDYQQRNPHPERACISEPHQHPMSWLEPTQDQLTVIHICGLSQSFFRISSAKGTGHKKQEYVCKKKRRTTRRK